MIIETLTKKDAARYWGSIGHLLQKAIAFDFEKKVTLAGLYEDIQSGHSEAVLVRGDDMNIEGAAVVTATDEKVGKYLFIRVLGGNFDNAGWVDMVTQHFDNMAANKGCIDGLMFCGRRGWLQKLRRLGYREILVTMVRRLDK